MILIFGLKSVLKAPEQFSAKQITCQPEKGLFPEHGWLWNEAKQRQQWLVFLLSLEAEFVWKGQENKFAFSAKNTERK